MSTITKYEVILKHSETKRILGYTARRTKSALLKFAQWNASDILALIPDWDDVATYNKNNGWQFGDVTITFSGATEKYPTLSTD